MLDNRVASPSEIASELGTPLSNTSYHVRQLAALELVELVDRAARRGAIEHYYTARVRPTITDEGWGSLPQIVKRAHLGGALQTGIAHVVAAAETGGFDRDDIHYSRTTGRLDQTAWRAIADDVNQMLRRVEEHVAASESRIAADPALTWDGATVLMMLFAEPGTKAPSRSRPTRSEASSETLPEPTP